MAKVRIDEFGIWRRRVPGGWRSGANFRTDVPESVINDRRVQTANFQVGDQDVAIDMDELRHALQEAPRRRPQGRDAAIVVFTVSTDARTVAGNPVPSLQILVR